MKRAALIALFFTPFFAFADFQVPIPQLSGPDYTTDVAMWPKAAVIATTSPKVIDEFACRDEAGAVVPYLDWRGGVCGDWIHIVN